MPYLDVLFPETISAGCRVVPMFNNSVVRGQSGKRDVQINWDAPLRKLDVGHVVKDRSTLAAFLDFWITVRGTAYSFKVWDPTDYEAGVEYQNDVVTYIGSIVIGAGDGIKTDFQMYKYYGVGVNQQSRKITKPVDGTVKVYVDDIEKVEDTDYTIDYTTGVISFMSPVGDTLDVSWAGHFYIEASFESAEPVIQLDSPQVGEWNSIVIMEERV